MVDVAAGLHPEPEPLVLQQHHATRPDDEPRPGDVDRIDLLRERIGQRIERLDERADRVGLPVIDRVTVRDGVPNKSPQ